MTVPASVGSFRHLGSVVPSGPAIPVVAPVATHGVSGPMPRLTHNQPLPTAGCGNQGYDVPLESLVVESSPILDA